MWTGMLFHPTYPKTFCLFIWNLNYYYYYLLSMSHLGLHYYFFAIKEWWEFPFSETLCVWRNIEWTMPAYLLGKSSYEIHQLYISRGLNHDMVVQTIHWQDLWTHLRRFWKSKYRICTMVISCMGIILQGNWVAHEQWPNVDLLYLRQYPDATWDSQFKSLKLWFTPKKIQDDFKHKFQMHIQVSVKIGLSVSLPSRCWLPSEEHCKVPSFSSLNNYLQIGNQGKAIPLEEIRCTHCLLLSYTTLRTIEYRPVLCWNMIKCNSKFWDYERLCRRLAARPSHS
jgi:hypothetical protein